MRQTQAILFIDIDSIIPVRGKAVAGFDEFCATLDLERLPVALQLASLPDDIRGFGHVKERNIQAAAKKKERLLNDYRTPERLTASA